MKGLDTNILVRFLTRDDAKQTQKVYEIFKNAELEKDELYISSLVILELMWVLGSVYEISRKDILDSIGDLLLLPILKFEHQSNIQKFIYDAYGNNHDLSDLLIAYSAYYQGCQTTLTFDKKVSKFDLFELIK